MAPPSWLAHTFRALRHRDYRLYFIGQTLSLIGTWAQTTALAWLAYHLTNSSTWPALVAAAGMVPTFFLGVWGGTLADRWPKRAVILSTQVLFLLLALLLAALALSGVVRPWHLLVIAGCNGLITAVDLPARLAFVVDLVGRDDLTNAVALNSLLFNVARAAGPALAGLLLDVFDPGSCFLLNALSYVAVLIALACMRTEGPPRPDARRQGWGAALKAFDHVAAQPRLALILLLAFAVSLFGWPFLSLLPRLADNHLGVGKQGYSFLVSATGCGALFAALAVASFATVESRRWFLGGGIALAVAGLLGLSLASVLAPAILWCGLLGFGLVSFMANAQAAVQLGVAEHNRGRVLGIWSMALSGGLPLGNLLGGLAADAWSEPAVLRLQALACAASALLLAVWLGRKKPDLPQTETTRYDPGQSRPIEPEEA